MRPMPEDIGPFKVVVKELDRLREEGVDYELERDTSGKYPRVISIKFLSDYSESQIAKVREVLQWAERAHAEYLADKERANDRRR